MALRFDPFQVFEASKSPPGLYARGKWLGETHSSIWNRDFHETVSGLLAGQKASGSWDHSALKTIRHLFGLHLTVRNATTPVMRGLDWLMDRVVPRSARIRGNNLRAKIQSKDLWGLPFTRGRSDLLVCGATLFLCTIFGREDNADVLAAYDWLAHDVFQVDGRWCGWSCSNNILRAFVVHPRYSRAVQTTKAVQELGRVQDADGKWPGDIPFFQTINALAHLNSKAADRQLEAAFRRLCQTQNADGTWGQSDREWKTFLAVHALKNKGRL